MCCIIYYIINDKTQFLTLGVQCMRVWTLCVCVCVCLRIFKGLFWLLCSKDVIEEATLRSAS